MGGIAAIAKAAGHRVTGCDANVYPPMSTQLEAEGIELTVGYSADQTTFPITHTCGSKPFISTVPNGQFNALRFKAAYSSADRHWRRIPVTRWPAAFAIAANATP